MGPPGRPLGRHDPSWRAASVDRTLQLTRHARCCGWSGQPRGLGLLKAVQQLQELHERRACDLANLVRLGDEGEARGARRVVVSRALHVPVRADPYVVVRLARTGSARL